MTVLGTLVHIELKIFNMMTNTTTYGVGNFKFKMKAENIQSSIVDWVGVQTVKQPVPVYLRLVNGHHQTGTKSLVRHGTLTTCCHTPANKWTSKLDNIYHKLQPKATFYFTLYLAHNQTQNTKYYFSFGQMI